MQGDHFDVHRFHPPLVYGRRGNAENGEGISLAVGKSKSGERIYLLITYVLPIISARAVPQQINYYNEFSKPNLNNSRTTRIVQLIQIDKLLLIYLNQLRFD